MLKRQYILYSLLIIFIFVSFTSLKPMLRNTPFDNNSYSINTDKMNIRHRPPLFYLKENGVYFIHPATTAQAKATFTFSENKKKHFHFSIQDGSTAGKILFIVKKNDDEFKKFVVSVGHDYRLNIKIKKDDKITIIADANGSTAGDWGNLEILDREPHYILKLRLIPLLWVIFFIYLINKGYIYIAFSSYFGFLLTLIAEKISYGPLSYLDICIYTAFFFLYAFILILFYQELKIFKKFRIATILSLILTIAIYIFPISFIVFFAIFNKPIDWNILFAIYQTNINEAIEFIESFVPTYYLFGLLFIFLLIGYLFWRQEDKERKTIERSLLMLILLLLIGFITSYFTKARTPSFVYNTFIDYHNQIERLISFQNKRKASKIKFSATKKEKGEIYVVVIGESLNKYNMGIYNHFRNTTPRQSMQVKKYGLQVFNNTYSNAGNTMRSLSFALTEANQYNKKNYLESLSFIDIFNKANFDTTWIAAQPILNESNTIVSVIAQSSKHVFDLTNSVKVETGLSSPYDENTIEELRKRISNNKNRNLLLIIHIYGNHFRYGDRYPEKYSKYKKTEPFILGTNRAYILEDYTNYDNSVYYNDYVISSLLDVVKEHGGVSAFLYFSDHGEAISRHHGHTSRLESFTYAMVQIPFTAWLSPEYIKRYPKTYKTFISHKDKLFSSDMIYDTIIGLAHIKTNHYNAKYDLSSTKYNIDPKDALTLHGRLKYTAPNNYYYWQKYNTKLLKDNNLTNKIVISDTDTVGKLNDAWRLGYRSFKLNLKYIASKKEFQVGTKKYDTKGNILNLLSFFKIDEIENLFLNFTNLEPSNIKDILARVETINNKLNIKQKTTLLSDKPNLLKEFKNKGWKVALINSKDSEKIYINNNILDYYIVNFKSYKEYKDKFNNIIIEHYFKLANSKLNTKLNDIQQLINNNKIKFLFIDFTSEYDD